MDSTTYHKLTSYSRYHMAPHYLDWDHVPLLHKPYPALPSVALKPPKTMPEGSLRAVSDGHRAGDSLEPTLGFQNLSAILMLANGITAQRRHGSQTQLFRSSPSAGALYPNEIYVAAHDPTGLTPGIYNYQVMDGTLVELRKGLFAQQVHSALSREASRFPAASGRFTMMTPGRCWR